MENNPAKVKDNPQNALAQDACRDFYEDERKPEARKISFINFRLGKEWYGVEISKVKDVAKVADIAYLPCAPGHICGIMNLRGNILSVTDLKKIFGLSPAPLTKESRILVICSGELETSIVVDAVSKVVDVELNNIDPPLETLESERAEYIVGECKIGDVFFAILNAEKIFALR